MSDQSISDEHDNLSEYSDDSVESLISDEDGLKAAEDVIKNGGYADEKPDSSLDENKEFLVFLKNLKKAKDLGLNDLFGTTIYQGGVHVKDGSTIYNKNGNIAGGSQKICLQDNDVKLEKDKIESHVKDSSVESIFDSCEDVRKRIFMIALAVLNGCNYRTVFELSQRLQFLTAPDEKNELGEDEYKIFNKKRSQWLGEISAHLNDGYELTEYGKSKIKTVSFINADTPWSLLSHVWNEYDFYTECLLRWLYELGEHSSFEARLRSAVVAGQLAIYEFRPIREKIFLPWAKSKKPNVQKLAALSLSYVAYEENEEVSQQALNLLHNWSGLQNSPRLLSTAVTAYAGYTGVLDPRQALEDLKRMANSGNAYLFPSIVQALISLFNAGRQVADLSPFVLTALKEWTEVCQHETSKRISLLAFWGIMRDSWMVKDDIRQPVLLWLAEQSEHNEFVITHLIRKSLNFLTTRKSVLSELFNWMKFIDNEKIFYKKYGKIIFRLANSPGREQDRILFYLEKWSAESDTAGRILKVIKNHL